MHALAPLVFLVGTLAGGYATFRLSQRRSGGVAPGRFPRLKLASATAVATLLFLAVAAYGFVAHRFRSTETSPASLRQAVDDFRRSGGGAAADGRGAPRAGVYTYHGKGFFEIDAPLLGKKHLKLPPTIPAILRQDGPCFELAVRPYENREWTERYCRHGPRGFRLEWRKEKSDMFGIRSRSTQECRPSALFDPTGKPRTRFEATCRTTQSETNLPFGGERPPMKVLVAYLGEVKLEIGGRPVTAHHLRQTSTLEKQLTGSMVRNVWYAADTGMLLKLHIQGSGAGMATIAVDQTYTLASLTPRR